MLRAPRHVWMSASVGVLLVLGGASSGQVEKKAGGIQVDGLKNLRHADANVRYRTAALIAKQGPQAKYAIEELRTALDDADPLVRVMVAEAIWKVERPGASVILPTLQRALKDKNAEVRVAACNVIGLMGAKAKAAVPALIEGLKDKDQLVAINAVAALGDIGPSARDAAPSLLQLSGYGDFIVLEPFVGAALADMGEAVVPELIAALKEGSLERRRVAAYALGSMGVQAQGAVKGLTAVLADKAWILRSLAARALGNVGKGAKTALARLREATDDKIALVRIPAALAVWQVSGETAYVPVLTRSLGDEAIPVRQAACSALATIGADAKDAAGALTRSLADKEPLVRQGAAEALGSIGPAANQAAGTLRVLLKDMDKTVGLATAFALWRITGEAKEPLETLRGFLAEEAALQTRAIEKLGALGPAARDALPDLVIMYREEEGESLRRVLADAIKKIDPMIAGKLGIR
jgi:HEAT repeat protein